MSQPTRPSVRFRSVELEAALELRSADDGDSLGLTAKRDLERYYALLARELRGLTAGTQLTEREASLLVDAGNGTLWEPTSIPLLWAEISDAISLNGLDQKWDVDGSALVAKLRSLSLGQTYALVDAIERFWQPGSIKDTAARLREVGLVR